MTYTINIQVDDEFADGVDQTTLLKAAELTLATCHEPAGMLTLVITDDATVQQLNREYRGIDAPTDVLSFANRDASPLDDAALHPVAHDDWLDAEEEYLEEYEGESEDEEEYEEENSDNASSRASLPPELADELSFYLGDIIIAYPYAARQAADYHNSVAAELRLLAVHGVLHLLGYDHGTAEDEAAMWAYQRQILAHFGDVDLATRVYGADQLHE